MTAPQTRPTLPSIIRDHHRRIRRLEASPGDGGGTGGFDCLNCDVLIPGGIPVPDALRDCVGATGGGASGGGEFNPNNGLLQGPYGPTIPIGKAGNIDLVPSVRLQAIATAYTGVGLYAGAGQMSINLYLNGITPASKNFSFPDLLSQEPDPDTGVRGWTSGWVNWFDALGPGDCSVLTADVLISQNAAVGGPNCGWFWGLRWVPTTETGTVFRGALDDIPQGEAFGDVIYFDPVAKEFVEGPRSVPSRAIATFMGG